MPGSSGTGGAYLADRLVPWLVKLISWCSEASVGRTCPNEGPEAKTRFRYKTSPAAPASRHTSTGRRRSRVSVPTSATVTVAPRPPKNHAVPMNSGYSDVAASMVAMPAAIVWRWLQAAHLGQPDPRPRLALAEAGRAQGAAGQGQPVQLLPGSGERRLGGHQGGSPARGGEDRRGGGLLPVPGR